MSTTLPPGTIREGMRPATSVGFNFSIKERPTDYVSRVVIADKAPFESIRRQILRSIENALNEDAEIIARMNELSEEVRTVDRLTMERDRIQASLEEQQANAIVEGVVFDDKSHREKIDRLSTEIKTRVKRAASSKVAISILQSKHDDLTAKVSELHAELARTNQRWMEARHIELMEQFRFELHGLQSIIAEIIAIEQAGGFRIEKGWRLVEQMSSAIQYDSPFRPECVDFHAELSRFFHREVSHL